MSNNKSTIYCPACNNKIDSRKGNSCRRCGYTLEKSDLEYGFIRYSVPIAIISYILNLVNDPSIGSFFFFSLFAIFLNPHLCAKFGIKTLKNTRIDLFFSYLVWLLYLLYFLFKKSFLLMILEKL